VEERESFISTSRADAKQKLAQAERLEADLKEQLKDARQQSQKLILEAEQEMDRLYRDALAAATADANASREQARREIDSQRDQAMDRLNKDADQLGDLIVTRLLAAS
jgi:F-type H+-transporting ATPase subunit b